MRKRKLGEVLQERGHVSQHNLTRAMQEQAGKTILLGELLLGRGLVSKDDLVAALEQVTGLRYVDCGSATVHDNVLKFVPRRVIERAIAPQQFCRCCGSLDLSSKIGGPVSHGAR